ncbi:hypothetical protein GF361_01440 [Candidatus Woesearchaeota archaeon]|nr:hypothetical protein [Candidatus Woesearchaeota archaeon]
MFSKLKKKAQGNNASAAAVLIALIGLFIILYILLIPPEEREKILGEDELEEAKEKGKEIDILLSESPGRLFPAEKREFEKSFPAVSIYVGEEGMELKKLNSLYTSRSLFRNNQNNITFEITDMDSIKDALLNFYIEEGQGRLMIRLNGNEIFDKEQETGNINPINLNEHLIQGDNLVEFEVSSPGAAFWRTNEYSLEDILVTADILRKETQESALAFVASEEEINNMEKVKLRFTPDCTQGEAGTLTVQVNNYELYSAVADCNVPIRPLEFIPERLVAGENILKFFTNKGRYLIDNIMLNSELKEAVAPVYYFEIERDDFEEIEENGTEAVLYIEFVDDVSEKVADITINNRLIRLDQTEVEFNQTISKWVDLGNNAFKIEPEEVLDIVELKVSLET